MKKEELSDILGEINDTYIRDAHREAACGDSRDGFESVPYVSKGRNWVRWAAPAACLMLVLTGFFFWKFRPTGIDPAGTTSPSTESTEPIEPPESDIFVNWVEVWSQADYPAGEYERWAEHEEYLPEFAFRKFTGLQYDEFVQRIPKMWTLSSFSIVTAPDNTDKETYTPHDFTFRFFNSETGWLHLRVSHCDRPQINPIPTCDDPRPTTIGGVEMWIYGDHPTDEGYVSWYQAEFSFEGLSYFLVLSDGTQPLNPEELDLLVETLRALVTKEPPADPQLPEYVPGSIELEDQAMDDYPFERKYRIAYYRLWSEFEEPLSEEEKQDVDSWFEDLCADTNNGETAEEMILVSFIKRYNITRAEFDAAVEQFIANNAGTDFTAEEWEIPNADIIYTFDNEIINHYYRYE